MRIEEIIVRDHPEKMTVYSIGFIDPKKGQWQGDGVANDETQLEAESLEELASLYEEFCRENGFPEDTVTYIEIEGEEEPLHESESVPAGKSRKEEDYRQYLDAIIENLLVCEKPVSVIGYLMHIGMSREDIASFSFSNQNIAEAENCKADSFVPII